MASFSHHFHLQNTILKIPLILPLRKLSLNIHFVDAGHLNSIHPELFTAV